MGDCAVMFYREHISEIFNNTCNYATLNKKWGECMILEFKATLKDVGEPVWRKIELDENTTFYDFHRVLQVAFDWDNYHLHSFFVQKTKGERTGNVEISGVHNDDLGGPDSFNEKKEVLSDWFKASKDKVTYLYDFGDDWNHEIVLNKKKKSEQGVTYPRCVDAKNLAPEEDTRGEVIMGDVDLVMPDSTHLAEDVNAEIRFQLKDLLKTYMDTANENDNWSKVLLKAKEFLKHKPWETMNDEHIFAVKDPVTEERLYCSVIGAGGETFGLAVYIGEAGYNALIDTLEEKETIFDLVIKQRSLLLTFEDREDLEKEDYNLVKSYDTPFRGRKSWPAFRSYKPGLYPWVMDDEEARLMLLSLEQVIEVFHEIKDGQKMPDMLFDNNVLLKVPYDENGIKTFKDEIVQLEENNDVTSVTPLLISELELKQLEKKQQTLSTAVEFAMEYVNMPVKNESDERPAFPLLVLGVDQEEFVPVYQELLTGSVTPDMLQSEFLKMIKTMGGVPARITVDQTTANHLVPVTEKLGISVEVKSHLPVIRQLMTMMHEQMEEF